MSMKPPKEISTENPVIINLDDYEEVLDSVLFEWDSEVRHKFCRYCIADNEKAFNVIMEDYIKLLQARRNTFKDFNAFKTILLCHIRFLYSYFMELKCGCCDNYLENMKEILTAYCNTELKTIQLKENKNISNSEMKKLIKSAYKRIINMLTLYLLDSDKQILHVLIKMDSFLDCTLCKQVVLLLYKHFLVDIFPRYKSDEAFCYNYILFIKWKQLSEKEDWGKIDKIMFSLYGKPDNCIEKSPILKEILIPTNNSAEEILSRISKLNLSETSFNYMNNKKQNAETNQLNINIKRNNNNVDLLNNNNDNEDDADSVEFIGISKLNSPLRQHVCIINDDSNDIAEIHYVTNASVSRICRKERKKVKTYTITAQQSPQTPPSSLANLELTNKPIPVTLQSKIKFKNEDNKMLCKIDLSENNENYSTSDIITNTSPKIQNENEKCNELEELETNEKRNSKAHENFSEKNQVNINKIIQTLPLKKCSQCKKDSIKDCDMFLNETLLTKVDQVNHNVVLLNSEKEIMEESVLESNVSTKFQPVDHLQTNESSNQHLSNKSILNKYVTVVIKRNQVLEDVMKEFIEKEMEEYNIRLLSEIGFNKRQTNIKKHATITNQSNILYPTCALLCTTSKSADDLDFETRLPLKKRKLSITGTREKIKEEFVKKEEEISYPSTKMISIAELEFPSRSCNSRQFKTPAELKEMPSGVYNAGFNNPSRDQFNINSHICNNPTITCHINNVFPMADIQNNSYFSMPPITFPNHLQY